MLEKARRENFPVALRWLPAALRRDLLALYGFARLVDDAGDEAPGDRPALLDAIEADLLRAFAGRAHHPLLRRLEPTLRDRGLPLEPFLALIEANRRDQRIHRYATFAELRDYCRLSAEPVGRLVLALFGAQTPDRVALSDAICTALQLVEHCQDVREDFARGRIYLPGEDRARFGCSEAQLAASPAPAPLRAAVAQQAERARGLLHEGEALVGTLRGAGRLAVLGFAAGGHAALDALERANFDVSDGAPRPRRRDLLRHALRLFWRSRR